MTPDVLDRGGHLSELALDRYRYDARDEAFASAVEAHLATCAACRDALTALITEDSTALLPVPVPVPVPVPDHALDGGNGDVTAASVALGSDSVVRLVESPLIPRATPAPAPAPDPIPLRRRWLVPATALLAAAALALIALPPLLDPSHAPGPDGPDTIRLRGAAFDFEIHVHDGVASRPVSTGDRVHPGERMGFRVMLREAGWLAIVGRDDRGARYPCYPEVAAMPVAGALEAAWHARTEHLETLPVAMRFDDTLGTEHVTAVFCPHPFVLDATFDPGTVSGGDCAVIEIALDKVPATEVTP